MQRILINHYLYLEDSFVSLLQPVWPLKKNLEHGPYMAIEREEVARSLHQDLLFLLRTIPGEWPMRPALGVGLTKYLFETANSQEFMAVVGKIKQQVKRYLPAIQITSVDVKSDPELIDISQAHITIHYYVKRLNLQGSMNVGTDGWTVASDSEDMVQQNTKIESTINRDY